MKIEIRGGPPSHYNPDADNYVVLVLKNGREKLLGGPMTEDNAVEMVETIRAGKSPEDAAEDYEKKEVQPAAQPIQKQKVTYNHLAWVAVFYLAIAAALITVVILSRCEG